VRVRKMTAKATRGSDAKENLGPLSGRDWKAKIAHNFFCVARKRAANRRDYMRVEMLGTPPQPSCARDRRGGATPLCMSRPSRKSSGQEPPRKHVRRVAADGASAL
jgi:hypothetical protein